MKGKKILAFTLSAVLSFSLLAGCGGGNSETAGGAAEPTVQESTEQPAETTPAVEEQTDAGSAETAASARISDDPAVKITQGRYQYSYDVGDMDMCNYFHFYEEAPVIGSVFYAGFAMNQIFFVGTYKVEKADYDYNCFLDRAAAEAEEDGHTAGTAPYTITCYDWDGNELGKMGFDGDNIYNDCEAFSCVSTTDNVFTFESDLEGSKHAGYYAGEVGQAYMDFVAEDPTSTLTLYHNGTYMDMVGMMIEGNWSMEQSADGFAYTLTPFDSSDTGASFLVSSDKATAVYTPEGGDAVNMTNAAAGPAVTYSFAGKFEISGMEADLAAYCYQDGTAAVIASIAGMEMPLDEGTWELTETYSMLLHLGSGDYESAASEEGVSLPYANASTEATIGVAIDTVLDFVAE